MVLIFFITRILETNATCAEGTPLDHQNLWEFKSDGSWSTDNQITLIAAENPTLHSKALQAIQAGFARLPKLPFGNGRS